MEIADSEFGHWLAGFIDGEGCFRIVPNRKSWECRFQMSLRDDDSDILHRIRDELWLGSVYPKVAYATSHPQTMWEVSKHEDCLALVKILDQFPLRARKARDYAIW